MSDVQEWQYGASEMADSNRNGKQYQGWQTVTGMADSNRDGKVTTSGMANNTFSDGRHIGTCHCPSLSTIICTCHCQPSLAPVSHPGLASGTLSHHWHPALRILTTIYTHRHPSLGTHHWDPLIIGVALPFLVRLLTRETKSCIHLPGDVVLVVLVIVDVVSLNRRLCTSADEVSDNFTTGCIADSEPPTPTVQA
ncbi:hypothetical protein Hamer_G026038, partial [Homarus americanus]